MVSYTNCPQMLQEVKAQALKEVGPYGLAATTGVPYGEVFHGGFGGVDFGPGPVVARDAVPLMAGAAVPSAAVAGTASTPSNASSQGQDYSTTNDQEAGVDEPDMVKTNGQLMVILRQQPQGLQVVDVSGSTPVLDGFLALPQFAELDGMFLVGQRRGRDRQRCQLIAAGELRLRGRPGPVAVLTPGAGKPRWADGPRSRRSRGCPCYLLAVVPHLQM